MAKFVKGVSGNPHGRTQGTRNRFSEQARADALADWTANGSDVLARVRATEPATYLRVLFSIIPKDVAVSIEHRAGPLASDEMQQLRRLVEIINACAAQSGVTHEEIAAQIEEDLRARFAKQIDGSECISR
jgi:hypothetical protein